LNPYFILLVFGVFASSTSFVYIRESTEAPVMLAAYRLLLTALLISPLFLRDYRRFHKGRSVELFRSAIGPGFVLGLHFITWVIGARMTTGANATLIVSLVPLAMPFFMLFMYRENITRNEIAATGLALLGLLILAVGDFSISMDYLTGDLVCLVSMILFAYYLALAKNSAKYESIWLYVFPMYLLAGIFCFILALFFSSPIHSYSAYEGLMILLLAVVPTIGGHTILNFSMQKFRGQTVSIINMGQFLFAGIIAWFIYLEVPTTEFYIASFLFVISIWLVMKVRSPGR
jgi:drug/metabolite transporter (DMT)-like permease